jgi:hypothetical protein
MALLWFENFDSYTPGSGTIPSPWAGPGNSIISTAVFHSAPNGFGAGAGGNGGNTTRSLAGGTQEAIWTVDFWMLIPTGGGATDPPTTNGPGLHMTSGGGTVSLRVGGLGTCVIDIPFGATLFSFDLSLDTWHHLIWSCTQSATGSSNLSIDGVPQTPFSGDTRNSANVASSDTLGLLGQTIGPSPVAELYFDDIGTFNSLPAVAAGGAMSSIIL